MKFSVKSGLLIALFVACWQLFIFYSDQQLTKLGAYSGLLSTFIIFPFLFIGIKHKRDIELGGFLNTKEGLKEGAAISAVAGLAIGAFTFLFFQFVLYDFFIGEVQHFLNKEGKENQEVYLTNAKAFYAPFRQSAFALFRAFGVGILFSFISITFLAKKRPETD